MALRAMYKGIKKVLAPLIINRPGELAIDQDGLNTELNSVFFPRSEEAVLGAKNLLPNKASTGSNGGLDYTVNNGEITIGEGTATAESWGYLNINDHFLEPGNYILSGCPSGGGESSFELRLSLSDTQGGGQSQLVEDTGSGASFTVTSRKWFRVYCGVRVASGTVLSKPLVFKPMIRLATDPDDTYAPYSMTNKELTDDVATLNGSASDQKTAINAIITAATGAADFAAFKTAMGAITPVTRSIQVTPETREEITEPEEEPEVKKTTRKKSTAKADTEKEGE